MRRMYRIGIDVGGTNTDAVILKPSSDRESGTSVHCAHKTGTTPNITDGIKHAVHTVLQRSGIERKEISNVSIGTTHFINALLEADSERLNRVAVLRLCGPYTKKIPPFTDFPSSLRKIVAGPFFYCEGGFEIDAREIGNLDPKQIFNCLDQIKSYGIRTIAVVGVFSSLDRDGKHEERCKSLLLEKDPALSVVCSHSIAGPGFLERENATILNACILFYAQQVVQGFCDAVEALSLSCPLYLTQNDSTLCDAQKAAELPIRTIASGPTNSMTGAASLEGLDGPAHSIHDCQTLVVDVGGTTTDISGLLPSGFPRQASNFVEIAGVRTSFSMPDVYSFPLGGGTVVRFDKAGNNTLIGPDSVGSRLTQEAIVFGGKIVTLTDIAVAAGDVHIGDPRLAETIPGPVIEAAREQVKLMLSNAIDKMRVSVQPVRVILVGGGSVICRNLMHSVTESTSPTHYGSANAVGAAIARIAGEIDVVELLEGKDENVILRDIEEQAKKAAVKKGADRFSVTVAERDLVPLQYVTHKATRIVVKAVGKLRPGFDDLRIQQLAFSRSESLSTVAKKDFYHADMKEKLTNAPSMKPSSHVNLSTYRPNVINGVWYVSAVDIELIACGTGVLGTGGGGSFYLAQVAALSALHQNKRGRIRIVAPSSLSDADMCVFGSSYGAPTVSRERLPSGSNVFHAVETLNAHLGYQDFQAVVCGEIGGGNGIVTFPTGAKYDRPIVDCDLMGRAYPSIEQGTPYVYGEPIMPCAIVNGKSETVLITSAESNKRLEKMLRTTCVEMGASAAVAMRPLSGLAIKKFSIPNTVSQAWYIGRSVKQSQRTNRDLLESIAQATPIELLYSGKIIDVRRDISGGYTIGRCIIAPTLPEEEYSGNDKANSDQIETETRHLKITFQNEYLYAAKIGSSDTEDENVLCTVPDLVSILGEDGEAIGSPELRYGLKVRVVGMPAHPLWTGTEAGLRVGGPDFFGMKVPWTKLDEYKSPRSVIDEFNVFS